MKKKFNVKTTLIVTGTIQACLLLFYLVPVIYSCFLWSKGLGVSLEIWMLVRNFFLIPVAPICLIVNFISLIFSKKETSKLEKQKYIRLFLSEIFFMSIAWFFLWSFFVALNGGV